MFGCVTGEVGSPGSHGGDSQGLTAHTGDTAGSPVPDSGTLQILSPCTSGPQLVLHQGLISWKAIFPWTGEGGWCQNDSSITFIMHFISIIIISASLQIIRH